MARNELVKMARNLRADAQRLGLHNPVESDRLADLARRIELALRYGNGIE